MRRKARSGRLPQPSALPAKPRSATSAAGWWRAARLAGRPQAPAGPMTPRSHFGAAAESCVVGPMTRHATRHTVEGMKPRIHVITLAVADLERALRFYRALGLESPGIIGTEWPGDDKNPAGAVAMFQLENDLILAVYPRQE